jgi:hypothetical protein
MVCNRILPIIRPKISEAQYGFVQGCSTVISFMQLSDFVNGKIEKGRQVDVMYTDFLKAFDKLSHELLLYYLTVKLCSLLLCWMGSYFFSNIQQVKFDDYPSKKLR